nr:hypothetical protein [Tanacetum cinerariifolium]
ISEGGGYFVSSPQSNEALQTPVTTAAGGAEDSAALTALSLKLDRCLNRVTILETELGITKKVLGAEVPADTSMPSRTTRRRLRKSFSSFASANVFENIPAGASVPAAATTIPAGSSVDAAVRAVAAPSSSIPTAADKGKAPMVPAGVPAAPSGAADVSIFAATAPEVPVDVSVSAATALEVPADISIPAASTGHAAASVPAEIVVHTVESTEHVFTTSEHVSSAPTAAAPT